MKNRKIRAAILSAALAAVLLFAGIAPALAENVLVPAPDVELPAVTEEPAETRASAPYLPYARTLPERGDEDAQSIQYELPRLTDGELERIRQMMADLKEGKEFVWNDVDYVNKTENVIIGVYPLDPKDFDGETFYVILPSVRLSDDMLLSLIRAFDRLGIPFDPDSLNERNCMRNSWDYDVNRGLSYEEKERMDTIRRQVARGMIDPGRIPAGTFCLCPELAGTSPGPLIPEPFRFCIYPYRSMTDSELAAYAFAMEGVWDIDPDVIEAQALACIRGMLKAPLALIEDNWQMIRKADGTRYYEIRFTAAYADEFSGKEILPNGEPWRYIVRQKQEAGSGQAVLYNMSVSYHMDPDDDRTQWPDYSEADWIAAAQQWARNTLKLPEEKLPSNWMLALNDAEDSYVDLSADTEEMIILLVLNKRDAGGNLFYMQPKD